jgi:glycosyltransferase involved in cell wall biosynthesis
MPTVSVIVPIFNVAQYLEECLRSLAAQTFSDYEIILVNDGSTDDSPKIALEFQTRFPETVKLLSQKNRGLSAARNLGIEQSCGKYLSFVDGDDWVSPDFLQELICASQKVNATLVVCNYSACYANGRTEIFSGFETGASGIKKQVFLGPTFACNKLFARVLFETENVRFQEGICYEDLGVIPLLVSRAETIAVVEKPLYFYRIGRLGAITSYRDKRLLDIFPSLIKLKRELSDDFQTELEWVAIRLCVFRFAAVAGREDGRDIQRRIQTFLDEQFPNWRKNPYLVNEKKRIFVIKARLMASGLGWVLNGMFWLRALKDRIKLRKFRK